MKNSLSFRFILFAFSSLFALSYTAQAHSQPQKTEGVTPISSAYKVVFRGSATIGQQLMPELIGGYVRSLNATEIRSDASALSHFSKIEFEGGVMISTHVVSEGTAIGFQAYRHNECDLVMASRKIKSAEADGTQLHLHEYVLCADALTIVVHPNNPVQSLTIAQIRDIFSGTISDWSQISPALSGKISRYAQDEAAGTTDFFNASIMQGSSIAADHTPYLDQLELAHAVAADVYSIGFVSLPFADKSKPLAIAAKVGDRAVVPTPESISVHSYPLFRNLYLYAAPDVNKPFVEQFIQYLKKDPQAAAIIRKNGFVALPAQ